MNYDSFCMAAALTELAPLRGAFVDQVHQPEPLTLTLALSGRGPRRLWLLSADARRPRAHATAARRRNPVTPPSFCALLRKHLNGAHLAEAEQVRFDRILRLSFRRGEETRTLVLEAMGRHSNLVLLDEAETILGAVKHVPPSRSRVRPILPGQPYAQPPGERPDPRALTLEQLRQLLPAGVSPAEITAALSGWGTFAAREALARGGEAAESVYALMERVRQDAFEPTVFQDAEGKPRGIWAFPSVQDGWTDGRSAASISRACDDYYGCLERHGAAEALRKTLLSVVERALRTARLQQSEAGEHLSGVDAAEQLRIAGELLAAHANRAPRGAETVELPNWYDPESLPMRVALDPRLDARENARLFFRRYRRALASAEAALERIPELDRRVEELETLAGRLRGAGEDELAALHAVLRERGLLRETPGGAPGRREAAAEFPPGIRIKRVPVNGWEVLYGENAASNDFLTTRWAKPADLWLHARAIAGAHVLIRGVHSLDRLPPDVLREAARIAAARSEAKHSAIVPVDYTFRRYVRKPRGSGPGQVVYTNERTMHVASGIKLDKAQ